MIEIVSMLVVAQKNGIDLSDRCCRARWSGIASSGWHAEVGIRPEGRMSDR
jgi:hypothetical protein